MEEQFTPYDLALKLKELGFNEECFGAWANNKESPMKGYFESQIMCSLDNAILAPLWQQSFGWLRDEHNLHSYINLTNIQGEILYHVIICSVNNFETGLNRFFECNLFNFKTYEEARLECLKKLIEIIQNK